MWTKNGGQTLPRVFRRIDKAVPKRFVNQKIVVDDHSEDDTQTIAEGFGWAVHNNVVGGISAAANQALSLVESELFCSFEQDLLLNPDWYRLIVPYMRDETVSVASGVRFCTGSDGLQAIQRYVLRKYRGEGELSSWLRVRRLAAFSLGKTLDNTMYRTETIRELGGFPRLDVNAGVDAALAYLLLNHRRRWVVDFNVQSSHIRHGVKDELEHQFWYGLQTRSIHEYLDRIGVGPPLPLRSLLLRVLMSPFTGLFMALKTGEPSCAVIHPLLKCTYFSGALKSWLN